MSLLRTIAESIRISAPAKKRSNQWPSIRKAHLAAHGHCACCGGTKLLEVHHVVPFSENPELELNPDNLITLCESASFGIVCHLGVGHLGNYQSYNKDVLEDSNRWLSRLSGRP